ncbi:MAG TPA: MFS transporter [Phenylobacterium sp.]|jgi:putative MFS transporter|uniref:MFS transporter n=1 Tax=Phenylobacterium sp. TaxID=1871053 RepID=UPI002D3986FF|nr:MFS transporter [Phenylobacterium sp.]HZZ69511.1 MFS transporter [Phenylobacterium sp.]
MSQPTPAALISARIDRLPGTPYLWSWIARISFGAFFEIYEVALTTVLGPALVAAHIFHKGKGGLFGLPDQASFAFATFAGLFAGAMAFSQMADRWGRRPIFTASLVWYAVATVIMGLQDGVMSVCAWRFIAAIGIGAEVVAIDSYLAELTPKRLRGRGFAVSKSIQYLAIPLGGLLGALLVPHGLFGLPGWRAMAFLPVIGGVAIWAIRRGLPESPRWLAEHGREAEADQIVAALERRTEASTRRPLPALELPRVQPTGPSTFAALWAKGMRARVLMISVASSTGTIAYFGFGNWLPSLLEEQGVTITKSLLYSAATGLTQPLVPLVFLFFVDRIQRKWQIIIGGLLSAVFGLLFTQQTSAFGWVGCGVAITAANNLMSTAMHTYRGELFPTRIRGRAIGVVYSIDRIVAAFNSYIIGFLLVSFHVPGVFAFITGALVVCALTAGIFGPKTRGLATEEIGGPIEV